MIRIPFQGQQSLKALLKTTSLLSEGEVETSQRSYQFFLFIALLSSCQPGSKFTPRIKQVIK